jgi:hypothetical protein
MVAKAKAEMHHERVEKLRAHQARMAERAARLGITEQSN